MGVVKNYKRVEASAVLGLVATGPSVVYLSAGGKEASLAAVGANERVHIWNLLTKELAQQLLGPAAAVTAMARSPDQKTLAVGYRDGTVHIFDVHTAECAVTFHGHRRAVTAIAFDDAGMRLVSGSQDTDLTVWDVVSEAGLFRLKGHAGEITKVLFINGQNILVSSSKDKLVKFWDLETQHCFKTLVGHRTEVYSFLLLNNSRRLVTGSADSELRVWDITFRTEMDDDDKEGPTKRGRQSDEGSEDEEDSSLIQCVSRGSVMRGARDSVRGMLTDCSEKYLLCYGPGNKCEVFILASEDELQKKLNKRRKKARMKAAESRGDSQEVEVPVLTIEDEIRRVDNFRVSAKLRGVDFIVTKHGFLKVVALLNSNAVETLKVQIVDAHSVRCLESSAIQRNGHRSEVRTLAFSSDSSSFLSASGQQVKLWSRSSLQCISTLDSDYALCSAFAPGDRYIIIGTKSGKLQIFDIDSRIMTSCIDAHDDTIWSLSMAPRDKDGIITGSKDQTVKFWKFELVSSNEEDSSRKYLTLEHVRTLKMDDQVTCLTYSPDQRLVAVALLDNTVKVFFVDTLRLFHTLYGGSSPVLCMDISSDSTIIATGAADKNIKIWGLDFGDLKKSLFAHDDSVSCLKFVPKTHLFFSGGKDRLVKQWDADNYQRIITLKGHHAELRALAVSPCGNFVVSSSHDMSLRLWEKTDGILVLEEEREQEREKEEEDEVLAQNSEPVVAGEVTTDVLAGRKTVDTIKGVENLIEAVDIYEEETKKLAEHAAQCKTTGKQLPSPAAHPLMQAYKADSPAHFVLIVLLKIRSSEIEETLLVLPFEYATKLLSILEVFIINTWETELCVRCVCFLLRIHHGQITSNQVLLPTIERLRNHMERVKEFKDMVGYNLYALQLLRFKVEEKQGEKLFADASARFKERKKKHKIHAHVLS